MHYDPESIHQGPKYTWVYDPYTARLLGSRIHTHSFFLTRSYYINEFYSLFCNVYPSFYMITVRFHSYFYGKLCFSGFFYCACAVVMYEYKKVLNSIRSKEIFIFNLSYIEHFSSDCIASHG